MKGHFDEGTGPESRC